MSRTRRGTSVALVRVVALLAVVASASASASGAATRAPKSTFVVGVTACMSGPLSANFLPGANAAVAWGKWTNARGGINGHRVQVIVQDDGCDGARSLAAVRDLVENQKALVIIPSTTVENAWADYLAEKQVPAISGASTFNPIWGKARMLFPVAAVAPYNTYGTVLAAKAAGAKKARLIVCAEAPACKVVAGPWETYAPKVGIKIDGVVTVAASQPNFTAVCLDAKSSGVDFLHMGVGPSVGARLISDCQKQGYNPILGVTGSGLTVDYLTIRNVRTLGVQLAFPWFGKFKQTADFRAAMARYAKPTDLAGAATGTWTGLTMFATVAKSLPNKATPAHLLRALYQVKRENLGGLAANRITYTKGSRTPATLRCMFFAGIRGGRYYAPQGLRTACTRRP